ncbi:hypothetical protein SESBI_15806 [Sesbania bispinosa]|nr:hypothetical protein SESBI_15806 [Sesbania bispinosa]
MDLQEMRMKLIYHLKDCALFTESRDFINADNRLYHISHLASPHGDSIQRVATYFNEALACCHVLKMLRGVPKVLHLSKKSSTAEKLHVKELFFRLYPFLKIAYKTMNQTIIEAMEQEKEINILDLSAPHDATQWIYLMQSLKEHLPNPPPPYLKITITCIHVKKEVLDQMGLHLRIEAERLNFPNFQFHPVVSTLENLDLETLPVKKGGPLAISCVFQLHSLLATDEVNLQMRNSYSPAASMNQYVQMLGKQKMINPSPDSALFPFSLSPPKMECLLNVLWKLNPKVMMITEQEANVNGSTLTKRMDKALHFYGSLFDCLESSFSRTSVDRTLLEKMLLGEQIKNIVACEGVERKERYEKLKTWIPRLQLAGFGMVPVSSSGIQQAKNLLQSYVHGYHILQDNQCLFICWKGKPLFSVSAWRRC